MRSAERLPFAALLAGAVGIGFAPIFVRLSELGPSATAFYRLFFALPVLWLWVGREQQKAQARAKQARTLAAPETRPSATFLDSSYAIKANASELIPHGVTSRTLTFQRWMIVVAGLSFAADMALWHWSIKLTTVANATLLCNFAPLFVAAGARMFFRERISFALIAGMLLALAGGAMLVGASLHLAPRHVWGDAVALLAAVFYASYLLAVKQLTKSFSTPALMAWTGLVTSPALLLITVLSNESLVAAHANGWAILVALALISQVGGQGFIAYGLARLPASFSAVSLFLQPVVAAVLAWMLLSEPLSAMQIAGGCAVLAGIVAGSRGKRG